MPSDKNHINLSPNALQLLKALSWPTGNITQMDIESELAEVAPGCDEQGNLCAKHTCTGLHRITVVYEGGRSRQATYWADENGRYLKEAYVEFARQRRRWGE